MNNSNRRIKTIADLILLRNRWLEALDTYGLDSDEEAEAGSEYCEQRSYLTSEERRIFNRLIDNEVNS